MINSVRFPAEDTETLTAVRTRLSIGRFSPFTTKTGHEAWSFDALDGYNSIIVTFEAPKRAKSLEEVKVTIIAQEPGIPKRSLSFGEYAQALGIHRADRPAVKLGRLAVATAEA